MDREFISVETAKLLKEKGYNGASVFYSDEDAFLWNRDNYIEVPNPDYDADIPFDSETLIQPLPHITLTMAMRWIREQYNLFIEIRYIRQKTSCLICSMTPPELQTVSPTTFDSENYEDACEEAIKYCLKYAVKP